MGDTAGFLEKVLPRLLEIVQSADLATLSFGEVKKQISEEFHVDLAPLKAEFKSAVVEIIQRVTQERAGTGTGAGPSAPSPPKALGKKHPAPIDDEAVKKPSRGDDEPDQIDSDNEKKRERKEKKYHRAKEKEKDEEDSEEEDKAKQQKKRASSGGSQGGGFGFCSLSPELQAICGCAEMARSQVVKAVWDYVKEHNLQDPDDKRYFLCDEKLEAVFHVKRLHGFKMNKAEYLGHHLTKLESSSTSSHKASKTKPKSKGTNSEDSDSDAKSKKPRKGGGGFGMVRLSPELQQLCGGKEVLSRSEVVKAVWAYVRENNLQDPEDKRVFLCDEKMKAVFGKNRLNGFEMNKKELLGRHMTKVEGKRSVCTAFLYPLCAKNEQEEDEGDN